jgi:hypothetical protein
MVTDVEHGNQTILKNKNYELEKTIFDNLLDKKG